MHVVNCAHMHNVFYATTHEFSMPYFIHLSLHRFYV